MDNNHFAKALRNFTMSAAAGDAIKHLTDKGYTLEQVKENLTFPAPAQYIAEAMWARLVETRKILPADDNAASPGQMLPQKTPAEHFEIVEHFDEYGRKSFLRVQKESPEETYSPEDYVQYKNLWVISDALEQVSSLSDHIPLKVRNTGSHLDM